MVLNDWVGSGSDLFFEFPSRVVSPLVKPLPFFPGDHINTKRGGDDDF